ncbi:MAG: methyl-coenzyme M reductase operon protein D [Candidatus Methanomethylophilaceae archaeon]|nr:methyl-coenzyme M reductase operon protein D [Candidatus Methanomethylophilaceae archaeon]MBP5685658.1 methyl-coenzyme M reductase operon protein D [Candidatus Methanomethylophilaceae archaeon]MBP5735614.1 methyl-coenzyme M reductase operon protein D [Candidatus Methanomethylophilaceae archaeon]
MTNRLLSAETTEVVLNKLDVIKGIRQIQMTGESIPKTINSGPGKGLPNNHTERKIINVNGREVELRYLVGAFYIELEVEDEAALDAKLEEIEKVLNECIEFGYTLNVGRYSKYKPTLHDYRSE